MWSTPTKLERTGRGPAVRSGSGEEVVEGPAAEDRLRALGDDV